MDGGVGFAGGGVKRLKVAIDLPPASSPMGPVSLPDPVRPSWTPAKPCGLCLWVVPPHPQVGLAPPLHLWVVPVPTTLPIGHACPPLLMGCTSPPSPG